VSSLFPSLVRGKLTNKKLFKSILNFCQKKFLKEISKNIMHYFWLGL